MIWVIRPSNRQIKALAAHLTHNLIKNHAFAEGMITYVVLQVTGNQQKGWDINPEFTGAQFNDILPADGLITGAVNLYIGLHKLEGYWRIILPWKDTVFSQPLILYSDCKGSSGTPLFSSKTQTSIFVKITYYFHKENQIYMISKEHKWGLHTQEDDSENPWKTTEIHLCY